jgi:hypothetical protein
METKQNEPLIEIDYINFTKKLINEPTQKAKTFFLRSLHSLHYEVNKGLYEQIIYQIDGLITELRDNIFEETAKLFQRNPKRDYFELTKYYEINYRNLNRGQFSVKDLEGLRDLVYQFKVEQPAATESPKTETVEEKKVEKIKIKFNGMDFERAKQYFTPLYLAKNKLKQPFLSNENLEVFIQKCLVEDKKLETKLKLNFNHGEKAFIINVFHKFYTDSQGEYENSNSVDKYIQLLTDNFEQFVFEKIKRNFHKHKEKVLKV